MQPSQFAPGFLAFSLFCSISLAQMLHAQHGIGRSSVFELRCEICWKWEAYLPGVRIEAISCTVTRVHYSLARPRLVHSSEPDTTLHM